MQAIVQTYEEVMLSPHQNHTGYGPAIKYRFLSY